MIIVTSEHVFNNPKLNERNDVVNNTIREHRKKYGDNSLEKGLIMKYNIQFFDKTKYKTENFSTKRGVEKNIDSI